MLDSLRKRRSQYALGKKLPISESATYGLVREATNRLVLKALPTRSFGGGIERRLGRWVTSSG